jgi:hypothetical protein
MTRASQPPEESNVNKKSTTTRKLILHRETVRRLTSAQLAGIVGGRWNQTIVSQCECPTFTCTDPEPSSRVNTACTGTDMTNDC